MSDSINKINELLKLKELVSSNAITEVEFNTLKSNLLNQPHKKWRGTLKKLLTISFIVLAIFFPFYFGLDLLNKRNKSKPIELVSEISNVYKKEQAINQQNSVDLMDIDDVNVALKGELSSKVIPLLGTPDVEGIFSIGYYKTYTYAVYFDKVKDGEKIKHLIIVAFGSQILGLSALVDGEKYIDMNDIYVKVSRSGLEGNARSFNTKYKFGD